MAAKRELTLLSLTPEDRRQLIELASRDGCSITEYVRRMIQLMYSRTFIKGESNERSN